MSMPFIFALETCAVILPQYRTYETSVSGSQLRRISMTISVGRSSMSNETIVGGSADIGRPEEGRM